MVAKTCHLNILEESATGKCTNKEAPSTAKPRTHRGKENSKDLEMGDKYLSPGKPGGDKKKKEGPRGKCLFKSFFP